MPVIEVTLDDGKVLHAVGTPESFHFLLYSDGGCRNKGASALGYIINGIIFGYGMDNLHYILALRGERFDSDLPSFELEARALNSALARLRALISQDAVV